MIIPNPRLEKIPFDLHGLNFLQQICHKWHNPPRFKLYEDYKVTLDDGLEIICPAGFETDGASVPRVFWPVIEPTGNLLEGAILHDFYYQYGYLLAKRNNGTYFNKRSNQFAKFYLGSFNGLVPVFFGRGQKFGDDLLRLIIIEKHGATVDANRAYWVLRLFGHIAWKKYRDGGPTAYNYNSLSLPGLSEKGWFIKF